MTRQHPCAAAFALLACLALGLAPMHSRARPLATPPISTVAGKALVLSIENADRVPQRILALRTNSGQRFHVEVADPKLFTGLSTGQTLTVSGQWGSSSSSGGGSRPFMASSIKATGGKASKPKLSRGPPGDGAVNIAVTLSNNVLVKSQLSTIVIPIAAVDKATGRTCPGMQPPPLTAEQVRGVVFQELNPEGTTVGSTYNGCSYNKTRLTMRNSIVTEMVELPCSGVGVNVEWSFRTCSFDDYSGYADAADAALKERGIDLTKYDHRVYLVPPGPCKWVGLGYIGCDGSFDCRNWIGPAYWGTPQVYVHEIGHNLYLAHAGSMNEEGWYDEYADDSCTMGYCCDNRCFNTPHAWQMGWISVQQLDGSSLRPGQTTTLTLASQALSARTGVRIVPSWAPGNDPLFMGYRTAERADAALPDTVAGKVMVYSSPVAHTFHPALTQVKSTLEPGGVWEHPTRAAGLVLRFIKLAPATGGAVVSICRRGGAENFNTCSMGVDNDCNGLTGLRDPACSKFLRARQKAALPA